MRAFACERCGQLVFFENTVCLRCGTPLGYDPFTRSMVAVDPDRHNRCSNTALVGCNWLVPTGVWALCVSCRLTRTLPAVHDDETVAALAQAEAAKRRLVVQLRDLSLPLRGWMDVGDGGLAFDLLSSKSGLVTTGHLDGIITIDLAESDNSYRVKIRDELDEPYRTVLGHMRHEVGHYYWTLLVDQGGRLEDFRARFGDERSGYDTALASHYSGGPSPGWEDSYVSAYAAAHPWEDWAETFAHYLHIRDTLQTAAAWRMRVDGPSVDGGPWRRRDLAATPTDDADATGFEAVIDDWLPLTYALNAIMRSMGRDDLYPFVLSATAIDKLAFVHDLVRAAATTTTTT